MTHILGKNFKVLNSSTGLSVIACAKEANIDIKVDMQEVCSETTGVALEYIPKRYSWTASVNGLVADKEHLKEVVAMGISRSPYALCFSDGDTNIYNGAAYCSGIKAAGRIGQIMTYSATFQGTGELTLTQRKVNS